MLQAGLFSVTAMIAAVMANQLAYWARDYRLIAEKQARQHCPNWSRSTNSLSAG